MQRPDVSIIIVNWNTRAELLRCLASVQRCVSAPGREVCAEAIVVDNASTDGSPEAVRAAYAQDATLSINLLVNTRNLGFARAFNQGWERAGGQAILALNPDCELRPGALQTLLARLQELPDAGVLTPTLIDKRGRRRHSFANFPTLLTEGFNKPFLQVVAPRRYPSKRRRYQSPLQVESAVGACMLARRQAIERIGPMDESYFLYLEETDWCYRMALAGWRCYYIPDAVVVHGVGRSVRRVPVQSRLEFYRSRYQFFAKHYGTRKRKTLAAILMARLICGTVALAAATGVTLGWRKELRRRFQRNATLLSWHLRGCPAEWGLRRQPAPSVRPLRGDERLLIVKLGALGDVLHTLPAVAALKKTYPALRIAWAVETEHAALLQEQPFLDEVLCLATRSWRRRPWSRLTRHEALALWHRLASWHAEVAIDFQGLYKSGLLTRLSGARRRLASGLLREAVGWAYTEQVSMPTWNEHAVDRYLRLAAYLGAKIDAVEFPLPGSLLDTAAADAVVASHRLETHRGTAGDGPLVIIHAGAGKAANIWFTDRYAQLADRLCKELGARIAFSGAASERQLVAAIQRRMQQPSADLTGRTSLHDLLAAFQQAALCVAGDTGPAHLAAAVGCPVVSLFGPSNPQRTAPYRGATVLYDPPPCSPCYRRTYCSLMTCFQRLTVDQVFAACRERLALSAPTFHAHLPHPRHHLDRA